MNEQYWIGPHDIRIPNDVYFVETEDGENRINKWGRRTEMYCTSTLTKKQYINKYCYQSDDGYYYYDKSKRYYNDIQYHYDANDECCCLLF